MIGLRALLPGFTVERFTRQHWPEKALVVHGDPKRLRGLVDLPGFERLDELFARANDHVVAQLNDPKRGFSNIHVQTNGAPSLFRRGLSLYAPNAVLGGKQTARWLATLEDELGLDRGLIRPAFFVSPRGAGANLHFDSQESFVVQLLGRKRWTFAPNEDLAFPPGNYVAGTPPSAELKQLRPRGFITRMPKHAVTVTLSPGSVLFVPRGWWHQTLTVEDSLHIDLTMQVPTWSDAVLTLLQRRLRAQSRWRKPMTNPEWAASAFDQLHAEVDSLAQSMRAAPSHGRTKSPPASAKARAK